MGSVTMHRRTFLATLAASAAATQYEPTWDSLKTHPVPNWFHDAKLGIFIHWASTRCLPSRRPRANSARWIGTPGSTRTRTPSGI
ncbi:MAG: hypothetical protein FJW31_10935 [Acidobacteria bacterium]|nr:hypothetical protein [Acidobacteriota bacterium]